VAPPSLRCISCDASGKLTLTWVVPPDPGGQFFSYEIFRSVNILGPYVPAGSVSTYSINTFTDPTANGNTQSQYYFIKTRSGAAGTATSTASDTLRSIHLSLLNTSSGRPDLYYNGLHVPKLSTSASTFDVYREYSASWNKIKTVSAFTCQDTIYRCIPALYNYQIQLADNSGCFSASNIDGAIMSDQTFPSNGKVDSLSVNLAGQTVAGWNPSPSKDCIGYIIYLESGGFINNIDTVYGINNTAYTYTPTSANSGPVKISIAAIDSCGSLSPYDTPIHATIHLKTTYKVCAREAHLEWSPYGNMPTGVLKYDVFCSVNGAGWVKVGGTNSNSYDHTGLEPGKTYCYYVRALNNSQLSTSSSNMTCLIASAPPASSYAYIKSVSVNSDQNVVLNFLVDSTKSCRGFNIYKADNTTSFSNIAFVAYNGSGHYSYTDVSVDTKSKNYFYKVEILDSCGNARYLTSYSKTILLKVKNNPDRLFENNLSWDDYSGWGGTINGYNVYRVVNDVPQTTPVNFVPFGTNSFSDNVEDIVSESGKVGYFVEAVEGFGNPYGISATSNSNVSEAYVEAGIFVPNAFAPKGSNRKWMPVTQFVEKSDYHVSVFNRWGEKVFETDRDDDGWDGSGMDDGIYVYLINYKNSRGEFVELKGTITLVR
jgi:hypothetical protein